MAKTQNAFIKHLGAIKDETRFHGALYPREIDMLYTKYIEMKLEQFKDYTKRYFKKKKEER